MAVQPTKKILEELDLLEVADDAVVEFDDEDTEKIKSYWTNKKIRKQLLKDMSKYLEGVYYMFTVFLKEEEDKALELINETGKCFYAPQMLVKKIFESGDKDLVTSEVLYHAIYFAKQFELSDETLAQLYKDEPDLFAKLKVESKSIGSWIKRILLDFEVFKKLFALFHIDLPPDLNMKELSAFEQSVEEETDIEEDSRKSTQVDASRSSKKSQKLSKSQEFSQSHSSKAKKPKKDKSLHQEEKSSDAPKSLGDCDISSIHSNSVKQKDAHQSSKPLVAVLPFTIPQDDGENKVDDESLDSEEEGEKELLEPLTSPLAKDSQPIVAVLPFTLKEEEQQILAAPPTKDSSEVSTVAFVQQSLSSPVKSELPKPSQNPLDSPDVLSRFYGSPATRSPDIFGDKKQASLSHPHPHTSSSSFALNPVQVSKLRGGNDSGRIDLSKFYKVGSNRSLASPQPEIAEILGHSPKPREFDSPLLGVDQASLLAGPKTPHDTETLPRVKTPQSEKPGSTKKNHRQMLDDAALTSKVKTPQSERRGSAKKGTPRVDTPQNDGLIDVYLASLASVNMGSVKKSLIKGDRPQSDSREEGRAFSGASFFGDRSKNESFSFVLGAVDGKGFPGLAESFGEEFADFDAVDDARQAQEEEFRSPEFLLTAKRPEDLVEFHRKPELLEAIEEDAGLEAATVIPQDEEAFEADQDEEGSEEDSEGYDEDQDQDDVEPDVPDLEAFDPLQSVEFSKEDAGPGDVEDLEGINPYESVEFDNVSSSSSPMHR